MNQVVLDFISHCKHMYSEHGSCNVYKETGKDLIQEYSTKPFACVRCNSKTTLIDPFTREITCPSCKEATISLTSVRKDYKFKPKDLSMLDRFKTKHKVYHNEITLYRKTDVDALAVFLYGSLQAIPRRHKTDKAFDLRLVQINRILYKYLPNDIIEHMRSYETVHNYLINGKGGIRRIEAKVKTWNDYVLYASTCPNHEQVSLADQLALFETFINSVAKTFEDLCQDTLLYIQEKQAERDRLENFHEHARAFFESNGVANSDCDEYVSHVPSTIKEQYILDGDTSGFMKTTRRMTLKKELAKHDLVIRLDNLQCREYIEGYDIALDDVVTTLRENNFFYRYTSYSTLLRKAMDQEYNNARSYIRDMYGYINDAQVYSDLMEQQVNTALIKHETKVKVLANYNGVEPIPDIIRAKYMSL